VGNYGAHWVGVVDVRRHELLKKIQIAEVPGVAKLDPAKYLGEIKGINIAAPSNDGRYLYAADTDLGVVGVIDTREDKVVKVIRVGKDPWRIYLSHDGKYGITINNGDETISIIDLAAQKVAATLEAGPDMTGVNFAAGKAFVISSTSGFVYVYNMGSLRPAGRIRIGTNVQIETATTDPSDQTLYLAESTTHSVVIIDAKTETFEKISNVGLYPWGTHIMHSKDNYCH
jgi:YVTN family beta-propeller protein